MALFIQQNAMGSGVGILDPQQAVEDLSIIANRDTGLGFFAVSGYGKRVTYFRHDPGIPPTRLDALVNTDFSPAFLRVPGRPISSYCRFSRTSH